MKLKMLYAIIVFLLTVPILAQKNDNHPISSVPKYADFIDPQSLEPNFITDSFDNDSLYVAHNKNRDPNSYAHIGGTGKVFEDEKWFKKEAHKFELDTGTVWIFKASTVTGESVGIGLDTLSLPKGSQLSWYIYEDIYGIFYEMHGSYGADYTKGYNFTSGACKDLYIEYFEPKGFESNYDFLIKGWVYNFANKINKVDDNNILKSGNHGTAVDNISTCNNDINCNNSDFNQWRPLANSVFYINLGYTEYQNNTSKQYIVHGSGVFINKGGGGYSNDDKPYMLTCRHIFMIPRGDGTYIDLTKMSKGSYSKKVYINYKNDVCNSTRVITGRAIGTSIDLVEMGNSYNIDDVNYNHSEDFVLMQHSYKMSKFAKYGVSFCAWECYVVLNSPRGVASFGHPQGDVMKICIDDDIMTIPPSFDYLPMYYDIGIGEKGVSGGPLFNIQHQLIGVIVTKTRGGTCGDNKTRSSAGNFEKIYDKIQPYIDPSRSTYAITQNYTSLTPSHCFNCLPDYSKGETGVDCGGDCVPCYIPGSIGIRTKMSFRDKITAKHSIRITPSSDVIKKDNNNHLTLKSGGAISIDKNLTLHKGVTLTASIEPDLAAYDVERGCESPCVSIPNAVSPNNDGRNDYLTMTQKSVVMYNLTIFDRSNHVYYRDSRNRYIGEDNVVNIYNPAGLKSGTTYFYHLEAWNCKNEKVTKSGGFSVWY